MIAALALLVAAVFGAGDQYLGSMSWHPWAADVSLLSAPWLVLPFVAGWTQRDAKRGALLGLACTYAALVGYGLMTLSPVENAHLSAATVAGFAHSEARVLVGGLVTGPLFGLLGQRWRTRRAWGGALATALLVSLEPLAHVRFGYASRFSVVWATEIAIGIALSLAVLTLARQPLRGR